MQLTAKLIQVLPLVTGTSKNGDWKKQDFIVEGEGTYPKKICFSVWGDKINPSQLIVGNELKIDFDIESREYNSRWYTDLKAWKIELVTSATNDPLVENSETITPTQHIETLPDEIEPLPF
jgi:hypothetical protein